MTGISNTLLGLSLCLALGACQQTTTAPIQPAPSATPGTQPSSSGVDKASQSASGDGLATIPVTLDAQELHSKYTLDLDKLSYNFAYLDTTRGDTIKFQNGKATLVFSGLASGKRGDLKLEILEAGVVKLRAVSPGLVLTPGQMHISLVLKPVDSSQGGDLTLNVTVASNPPSGAAAAGVSSAGSSGSSAASGGSSGSGGNPSPNTGGSSSSGNVPSFARDVKPILDAHCAECHTPHGQHPDFSQAPAASIVDTMLSVLQAGQMPPKPRDQLTSAEIAKIKAWKDSGLQP